MVGEIDQEARSGFEVEEASTKLQRNKNDKVTNDVENQLFIIT